MADPSIDTRREGGDAGGEQKEGLPLGPLLIAAPFLVVCCGGAGFAAAGLTAVTGWIGGLGWAPILLTAVGAFFLARVFLRRRACRIDDSAQ